MSVIQLGRRLLNSAPRWLRDGEGGKVLLAIGAMADRMIDGAVAAIKWGHPGLLGGDSLSLIGADRLIRRAPGESNDSYAARLVTWRPDQRRRGVGLALLNQIRIFYGADISETRLQYRNGLEYVLHTDGSITRGPSTFRSQSGPPEKRAQWWLTVVSATGSAANTFANTNAAGLIQITREWTAEHTLGRGYIVNNARYWNAHRKWNEHRKWNSESPVTWEV